MWFGKIKKPWKPWHSGNVKASPSLIVVNRGDKWLMAHSAWEVHKQIWTMLLHEKAWPPFLARAGSVPKFPHLFYVIGRVGQHIKLDPRAQAWSTQWSSSQEVCMLRYLFIIESVWYPPFTPFVATLGWWEHQLSKVIVVLLYWRPPWYSHFKYISNFDSGVALTLPISSVLSLIWHRSRIPFCEKDRNWAWFSFMNMIRCRLLDFTSYYDWDARPRPVHKNCMILAYPQGSMFCPSLS